jgi:hypothetical protein
MPQLLLVVLMFTVEVAHLDGLQWCSGVLPNPSEGWFQCQQLWHVGCQWSEWQYFCIPTLVLSSTPLLVPDSATQMDEPSGEFFFGYPSIETDLNAAESVPLISLNEAGHTAPESPADVPILSADIDLVFPKGLMRLMLTNQHKTICGMISDTVELL